MELKSLRNERGYTLKEVAEGTGLSLSSLSYWESGERQPAADVLPKIAAFYGISIDELLGYKSTGLSVNSETEIFEVLTESENGYGYEEKLTVTESEVENALFSECDKVKRSFFRIGYLLTLINRHQIFKKYGFENIAEYAEERLGIRSTNAYNFMQVYDYTKDYENPATMKKEFQPYNQSQLVEMSRAHVGGIERTVKPTDTVKNIHDYVSLVNKEWNRGNTVYGETVEEALELKKADSSKEVFVEEASEDLPEEIGALELKNDKDREEFLDNEASFNQFVLENEEIGLRIYKRVLRNGATIYRTTIKEYNYYRKAFCDFSYFCLVDQNEEGYYNKPFMGFSLVGNSRTTIIEYLSKHRKEI